MVLELTSPTLLALLYICVGVGLLGNILRSPEYRKLPWTPRQQALLPVCQSLHQATWLSGARNCGYCHCGEHKPSGLRDVGRLGM